MNLCVSELCCSGATRVTAANNDCVVRTFDAERYSLLTQFTFPWSVNVSNPCTVSRFRKESSNLWCSVATRVLSF